MLCKDFKKENFRITHTIDAIDYIRDDEDELTRADVWMTATFFFRSVEIGRASIEYSITDVDDLDDLERSESKESSDLIHAFVLDRYGDTPSYVARLDIYSGWRRHGFGSMALSSLALYAGCVVAPDNTDAKRLYERIGDVLDGGDLFDEFYAMDQGYGLYYIRAFSDGDFITGK